MKDLFVIPTNRFVGPAVNSISQEIMEYQRLTRQETQLLILDNSNKKVFQENENFLQQTNLLCSFRHVGLTELSQMINYFSKSTEIPEKLLIELLIPDKTVYGKMSNWIYLWTVLLGAEAFHRRDSDCQVEGLSVSEYPVNQEVAFLGKNWRESANLDLQERAKNIPNEAVLICGSNYDGDWDVDLAEITSLNQQAMSQYMKLVGFSETEAENVVQNKYTDSQPSRKHQNAVLTTLFDASLSPECGNVSMTEVFKYIPNFIGENSVGVDYHTFFTAFQVKVPIVFHPHKIQHAYDQERRKTIDLYRYWRGIIKMIDFDNLHLAFLENQANHPLKSHQNHSFGRAVLEDNYLSTIPDIYEQLVNRLDTQEQLSRIDTVTEKILRPTKAAKYVTVADRLAADKEKLVAEIQEDYRNSITLQRIWRKLIKACEDFSENNSFYD